MVHNFTRQKPDAVVIGVSTGGVSALKMLLGELSADFRLPILVVSHILPESDDGLSRLLDVYSPLTVKEADEGDLVQGGMVYLAPANYHMLIDKRLRIALSVDPPVNFARPSVDVLFESAALVFGASLVGVVLTGAGHDGSRGLECIQQYGGMTVVQDPVDAEMDGMPLSSLARVSPDYICSLKEMPTLLQKLAGAI